MKRSVIFIGLLAIVSILLMANSCDVPESSTSKNNRKNEEIAQTAILAVEVPVPQNFLERKSVAAWFRNWDQPNKISYLYIFNISGCLGYFVVDGKPISNRSYLTPEEAYYMNGAVLQTPSLDGTFGSDNEGIRFKTGNGKWFEFGGTNFSYIYSDARIPALSIVDLTPRE